jgi:uncharacterized DUF497 family protein
MNFEWDSVKAKSNQRKHGVRFADAVTVLEDVNAITVVDNESDPNEERCVTVGIDAMGRILVVVYSYRGEDIRLISARQAEPHERDQYEGQSG